MRTRLSRFVPRIASPRQFGEFNRLLARVLEKQTPLPEALGSVADGIQSRRLRRAVRRVRAEVLEGRRLDEAMALHPRVFPAPYRSIVGAGLDADTLPRVLDLVASWSAATAHMRNLVLPWAGYVIAITAVLCVVLLLMSELGSALMDTFGGVGFGWGWRMPLVSRITFSLYRHARLALIVVAFLPVGLYLFWRLSFLTVTTGRMVYGFPAVGRMIKTAALARFCALFAALLEAGRDGPQAVAACAATERNRRLRHVLGKVERSMEEGEGFAEASIAQSFFPRTLAMMALAGQKRGALPEAMRDASELYLRRMKTLAAPFAYALAAFAVILVGTFVGFIVIGTYMPMLYPLMWL